MRMNYFFFFLMIISRADVKASVIRKRVGHHWTEVKLETLKIF